MNKEDLPIACEAHILTYFEILLTAENAEFAEKFSYQIYMIKESLKKQKTSCLSCLKNMIIDFSAVFAASAVKNTDQLHGLNYAKQSQFRNDQNEHNCLSTKGLRKWTTPANIEKQTQFKANF